MASRLDRDTWDTLISGTASVVAVVLILVGAAAVYGGLFGRENVTDRLEPQNVHFPAINEMTPREREELGDFAGAAVDTGPEAEAFARYIEGHLGEINDGKTYSDTSAEARAEGLDPEAAAELRSRADALFRGETLRSILLSAYGWWTVSTIALYVGIGMILGGIVLGILAILGLRHARRVARREPATVV